MAKGEMSNDRIRFVIPTNVAARNPQYPVKPGSVFDCPPDIYDTRTSRFQINQRFHKAFQMAFKICLHDCQSGPDGWTIICRPSQFARFTVYRYEAGFCNTIRELDPTRFIPSEKLITDVSEK